MLELAMREDAFNDCAEASQLLHFEALAPAKWSRRREMPSPQMMISHEWGDSMGALAAAYFAYHAANFFHRYSPGLPLTLADYFLDGKPDWPCALRRRYQF